LDVSESRLLALIGNQPSKIVVTPIGGQGFIFGRGNQPISPKVIEKVGRDNIIIVSLTEKLNSMQGEPFLVDSGDPEVDDMLAGYFPIVTGYGEKVIYRVAS
jgi:predicted polyphosphate/ATP-dependent NAD kinase